MKEIEFDIYTQFSGYKNKFKDMFFNDKFYAIIAKMDGTDSIMFVDFYNKEKLHSIKHTEDIKKGFTEFCKEQLREARDDIYNDLFIALYGNKLDYFSSYDEIDLRKVNEIRFVINSNSENQTLYFTNPEMVCDSCYLEKAIGKIKLLEFDNYEERNKFVHNYEWKQLVDYTENKQKSVQDYTQN